MIAKTSHPVVRPDEEIKGLIRAHQNGRELATAFVPRLRTLPHREPSRAAGMDRSMPAACFRVSRVLLPSVFGCTILKKRLVNRAARRVEQAKADTGAESRGRLHASSKFRRPPVTS